MEKELNNSKKIENSKNTENAKKKKIIIISSITIILILVIILLWWLFFRKIEVRLDYNNGTADETVLVRINKTINEDKINDKNLGERFIGWFKVIEVKDEKEILEEKEFDFKTKIKNKIKLNAVYKTEVQTITVKFDSRGGTKVGDIILKEGEELKLPKNPTRSGYKFLTWKDKNEVPIGNGALLADDITLYAYWEALPKVESISLSLSRSVGHARGHNTGKATATVKNPSGDVKYSDDSPCITIDEKTGDFNVISMHGRSESYQMCINNGTTVTITATLPSGKKASKKFTIEPGLVIKDGGSNIYNGESYPNDYTLELTSNVDVNWNDNFKCRDGYVHDGESLVRKAKSFSGSTKCRSGSYVTGTNFNVNPTTAGGQKISFSYYEVIN